MENIITSLSTLGIGGLMAAVVVYLMHYNTTVTIPKLIDQGKLAQEAFLKSLAEQEKTCHASMDKAINDTNAVWAGKVDRLTDKIDMVSEELKSLRERRI